MAMDMKESGALSLVSGPSLREQARTVIRGQIITGEMQADQLYSVHRVELIGLHFAGDDLPTDHRAGLLAQARTRHQAERAALFHVHRHALSKILLCVNVMCNILLVDGWRVMCDMLL